MSKGFKLKAGICVVGCFFAFLSSAFAFNSGSTGTEDLIVTTSKSIPLPPDGVLQYNNVHVQSGATLTFTKNAKNTPVTILASGEVTIEGTINVSGGKGSYILPGAGGPGGFDGGQGGVVYKSGYRGEGPGGGYGAQGHSNDSYYFAGANGGGGGHAAAGGGGHNGYGVETGGGSGGSNYGNERLVPLIGGSGGGGGGGNTRYIGGGGGGGGGAILIAASGTINVTGSISANGGQGNRGEIIYSSSQGTAGSGGGGAGGAIRLVATTITGNGPLSAVGAGSDGAYYNRYGGTGGKGWIRLEASNTSRTASTNPPFTYGPSYAVYPPGMPSLRITAINGETLPDVTSGDFNSPDVTLPFNTKNPITVTVSAENVNPGTTITLKANPATGNTQSASGALAGTSASTTANIDINISTSYPSVITAYVTVDASVVFNEPLYHDGEMVAQVRLSSTVGGQSEMTYITESGKEVPAYM